MLKNIGALDDLEDDDSGDGQGQAGAVLLSEPSLNQSPPAPDSLPTPVTSSDDKPKKSVNFDDVIVSATAEPTELPLSADGKFVLLEQSESRENLKTRDEPEVVEEEEEPESEA